MVLIGIDIGTTTISGVAVDQASGMVLQAFTIAHQADLPGDGLESKQDAERIVELAKRMLDTLLERFPDTASIGLTGQMHGIVYTDRAGKIVSPLYTWQDRRSGQLYRDGLTYAQFMRKNLGLPVYAGYGVATHFYHTDQNSVPENARYFSTIHACFGMQICQKTDPVLHITDSAGLGAEEPALLPISWQGAFPRVTEREELIGEYRGVPVAVGIGDNQASYLGAVRGQGVLVNVGTGSQVSLAACQASCGRDIEERPLDGQRRLFVGAALCGGKAYMVLERFFRRYALLLSGEETSQFNLMNRLAVDGAEMKSSLKVDTQFSGTRQNPGIRGSITGIGTDNLTPEALVYGTLAGIAEELHQLFLQIQIPESPEMLVGAGNGLRKNRTLCRLIAEKFGLLMRIPVHAEEAAYGAALFAMAAAGIAPDLETAQKLIQYQEAEDEF